MELTFLIQRFSLAILSVYYTWKFCIEPEKIFSTVVQHLMWGT